MLYFDGKFLSENFYPDVLQSIDKFMNLKYIF